MWLAIAINYIDRTMLSAAAHLSTELSIPADQMGFILSAFFWSYVLLQIPAGWFTDKFGQKIASALASQLFNLRFHLARIGPAGAIDIRAELPRLTTLRRLIGP